MLVRVVLACRDLQVSQRIARLLPSEDLELNTLRGRTRWEQLVKQSAEVFLLSHDLIPDPPSESFSELWANPERPDVFVLSRGDKEESARLLTAGATAVFDPILPTTS